MFYFAHISDSVRVLFSSRVRAPTFGLEDYPLILINGYVKMSSYRVSAFSGIRRKGAYCIYRISNHSPEMLQPKQDLVLQSRIADSIRDAHDSTRSTESTISTKDKKRDEHPKKSWGSSPRTAAGRR